MSQSDLLPDKPLLYYGQDLKTTLSLTTPTTVICIAIIKSWDFLQSGWEKVIELRLSISKSGGPMNFVTFRWFVNEIEIVEMATECDWDPAAIFPTISVTGKVKLSYSSSYLKAL